MKDLIICYDNENGETIGKSYDTVIDFIDEMESDNIDIPMMDYTNVYAEFFGNILTRKHFDTIHDLYEYCKMIVK